MTSSTYLLAGQVSELERLQLQSRVWEPSGRRLLEEIGDGGGARAVDIGCGVMGWLRLLSEWVVPDGEVVGTDIDDAMLAAAKQFVADEGLPNVVLRNDDLFATRLEPASFDLVHARGAAAAPAGGRERASGTGPLGHHVHGDAVVGPAGDKATLPPTLLGNLPEEATFRRAFRRSFSPVFSICSCSSTSRERDCHDDHPNRDTG